MESTAERSATIIARGAEAATRRVARAVLHPMVQHAHKPALRTCLIRNGTTGRHDDFGSAFSERFTVDVGPGYDCVNVQLAGWDLDFTSKDHHVDRLKVRIDDVDYDAITGGVDFRVSGYYRDKNGDDDFTWEVWYTILALG